ncbi:hypothetical protein KL905_002306 [Ogataea polymorpha]|uniref:Kinetochore protein Spc24 n=2 Tax=Ogataea TaxID=461281 RepID=W1QI55_OGAPD|nr:hypothetical protein HPODL_04796 [Ogataea parapolymorpha DL-1]XP_018209305.1 uncharacterized protein OGAPODRAFT_9871 [Ogataea polymorpha]KAG7864956.1 hypothetical protein KL918_005082 [Ogataea parapolymorpha]ESX02035.1 hypothetical protein HPODL_04796 [Ogataea parapolymorpha DL-1]KAG7871541.1 hypothetical protein KL916_003892 [Ogataea parapolymorpha]KAG7880826.1 hypothetical protein KL937_001673 [Ogataea polymorpha]KAG7884701.1 hypothetical protein KL938_001828 [Ogataea parapolymorpha]
MGTQFPGLSLPIVQIRSFFDIQKDLSAIDTINNNLKKLESLRQEELDRHQDKLDELQRELEHFESSIEELKNNQKSKEVKEELLKVEDLIFTIAKHLTSLNMELNALKLKYNQDLVKLENLQNQLAELEQHSIETDANKNVSERSKALKLKLYESLGLKLDFNSKQVLVLNKKSQKTNVLNLDQGYDEMFISEYIWDNI